MKPSSPRSLTAWRMFVLYLDNTGTARNCIRQRLDRHKPCPWRSTPFSFHGIATDTDRAAALTKGSKWE